LLYPLTIEDAVFDEALGILENALRKAATASTVAPADRRPSL
jgi:hypothetical protein